MNDEFYQAGLVVIFILSVVLFFTTKDIWGREPALELAVLSLVAIAAFKALAETGNGK